MSDAPGTQWLTCDHAWLGDRMVPDVVLGITDGRFSHVVTGQGGTNPAVPPAARGTTRTRTHLRGVTLPGLVNAHSHAFHRLLRARTQPRLRDRAADPGTGEGGTFWRWRDRMYEVAARLDPDSLYAIAVATYGEMVLAGITCVGEFHYLHHGPGGVPYDDPNAMGRALVAAASDVGIRMMLIDTLYLTGHVGATLEDPGLDPVQQRFSDRGAPQWAERVAALTASPTARVGGAIHSVRAVPPASMATVATAVEDPASPVRVLHAHVAEQPREVADAMTVFGVSPTQLLADAGALSPHFTAVHAVWLDDESVDLLAQARATVCACPTTERDLADGVIDAATLATAGVGLALGSDQHAVIDLFEEARALELDQRLATGIRGHHDPASLLGAATRGGAASVGWPEAGVIAVGAPADLTVVGTDSVRLAGTPEADLATAVVYAATASDVTATMVGGQWVVRSGSHVRRDVAADLRGAFALVTEAPPASGQVGSARQPQAAP